MRCRAIGSPQSKVTRVAPSFTDAPSSPPSSVTRPTVCATTVVSRPGISSTRIGGEAGSALRAGAAGVGAGVGVGGGTADGVDRAPVAWATTCGEPPAV